MNAIDLKKFKAFATKFTFFYKARNEILKKEKVSVMIFAKRHILGLYQI